MIPNKVRLLGWVWMGLEMYEVMTVKDDLRNMQRLRKGGYFQENNIKRKLAKKGRLYRFLWNTVGEGMATHFGILAQRILVDRGP